MTQTNKHFWLCRVSKNCILSPLSERLGRRQEGQGERGTAATHQEGIMPAEPVLFPAHNLIMIGCSWVGRSCCCPLQAPCLGNNNTWEQDSPLSLPPCPPAQVRHSGHPGRSHKHHRGAINSPDVDISQWPCDLGTVSSVWLWTID